MEKGRERGRERERGMVNKPSRYRMGSREQSRPIHALR